MKAYLSRRYRISASHRLHSDNYSEEQNRAVYGKCNHPHGHGHNYVIQVTVSGPVDPITGMVCNLTDLDGFMQRNVVERFDHKNLNLDDAFHNLVPTTENLCVEIYAVVSAGLHGVKLEKVRVEETSKNFFEYSGKPAMEPRREPR
jgi:6-pyruvoyltetrahydropterin/6-carboxytetrahydropterin synthase